MEPVADPSPMPLLTDSCLAFTPVAQQRRRIDGWTPDTQARFIRALAMGSVGPAAQAAGMGRASAYRLRERPDAASFAAAWDRAVSSERLRHHDYAIDRALNGVTIVRVLRGGAIDVSGGPDRMLVHAARRDAMPPPTQLKATKETE